MGISQWHCHLEARPTLSVSAVVCLDGATMHLHDATAEVQSDARSLDMEIVGIVTLLESFEEALRLFILETNATVDHF